ncbi:primosomal protein N' [Mollicutes bacterium LVI A0078]|nr:primosomal protein N' [Mollicutes bacterium LVI A0075]WOO90832.1 primosomal protein N' [Mollicutes bacterium LVI A0078]
MHVTVSVNISNTKHGQYSYAVNNEQYEVLKIGSQLIVNVNNQLKLGTVLSKSKQSNFGFVLKPILAIYKASPLNYYQSQLARTIYNNSITSMLDIQGLFTTKVPDSKININYYDGDDFIGDFKSAKPKKKLVESDYRAEVIVDYKQQVQTYQYVSLNTGSEYSLTEKQQVIVDYLAEKETDSISNVISETGVSRAIINTLVKHDVLIKTEKTKQFDTLFGLNWHKETVLSAEQQYAVDSFAPGLNLLHGVSSSGKTEVYIDLIKSRLRSNAQSLVIVPSVMLAVQVVGRLQRLFGENVIIYHNQLSDGEKASYRDQIENNQKRIVVSTFEGVTLPFDNLQLVIFDEAHSDRYKFGKKINVSKQIIIDGLIDQDIDVLLGTATPQINDYALTKYGKCNFLTLTNRYGESEFAEIEFTKPEENIITTKLNDFINVNKVRKKPSIIFFNKSGYSKQVLCLDCYHLHTCPNCTKPLSYVKRTNSLECKYDGYKKQFSNHCQKCNSTNIKYIGTGIEQFYEQLKKLYPELTIVIVDSRQTAAELYSVMENFGNGEIDILIGTQTIAFGIDFMNVDNIYVTNIDNLLTLNEVTSHEKTYNILEQVVGRVGRNSKFSRAIIETNFEQHFVMKAVENHSYIDYFETEFNLRKSSKAQPFYRQAKIEILGDNKIKLENVGNQLIKTLTKNNLDVSQLFEPYIDYRFNKHRRYFLIKYRHEHIREIILKNLNVLTQNNIDYNIDLINNEIGV